MTKGLDTGGFQVRRLPDYQPMDPRLFVEQPIQLGDIAREGLEGFNRGRQQAAEDEVRESRLALEEARLAQLEQQIAQQEENAPIERRAAGARAVGAGAQARLRQLQVEEAERQQELEEQGRRTVSEILEEGASEDFEGFEDDTREQIFNAARMAQVLDGTTGIPSQETFRAVSQAQFQSANKEELGSLEATQGQEFGEDGVYRDPMTGKSFIQVDGEMFTSRAFDQRAGGARLSELDEDGERERIIPVPAVAVREVNNLIGTIEDLDSLGGEKNQAIRRLRRRVNQYGQASLEAAGILLPEDMELQFDAQNLPENIRGIYDDTEDPEVRSEIEKAFIEDDLEDAEERIELLRRRQELESELDALMQERRRAQEPEPGRIRSAFQSAALGAAGMTATQKRSLVDIDTDIARVQEQLRGFSRAEFDDEQRTDALDDEGPDPIQRAREFNQRFIFGETLPTD